MSCCGKKRQSLASSSSLVLEEPLENRAAGPDNSAKNDDAPATTRFRYTGRSTLEVKGLFGYRVYQFSEATPELLVRADDAAVMRGYSELIQLRSEDRE